MRLLAWLFVLGLVLMVVSAASAQTTVLPLTHPKWVADSPATGVFIPTWRCTQDQGQDLVAAGQQIPGLRAIECVATTETKFVAWSWTTGAAPYLKKWPIFGVGEGDTCYTVPAGETRTYFFGKPWVHYIIVTSGDADFSGE